MYASNAGNPAGGDRPPTGDGIPTGGSHSGGNAESNRNLLIAVGLALVAVVVVATLILTRPNNQPTADRQTPSTSTGSRSQTTAPSRPDGADPGAPIPVGSQGTTPSPTTSTWRTVVPTYSPSPTTTTTTTTAPATNDPQPSPGPSTTTPAPSALDRLLAYRTTSLTGLVLDGRWVAQLASKYDGVVDPTQTAGDGSHTFHLPDILAEHERLRSDPRFAGVRMLLLGGGDFGVNTTYSQPLWVTLADPGGLADKAAVTAWCAAHFPGQTPQSLPGVCYPRHLSPPG